MHGGGAVRLRRDLRDPLPYEAQMISYRPEGFGVGGDDLRRALQRQEAAYLSGLVHLLSEAEGHARAQAPPEVEDEVELDDEGQYAPDYDEAGPRANMLKPQAALDPRLAEALLERYRQERMVQSENRDQADLRYLVEKILAGLVAEQPPTRPVQDRAPRLRRARRSLDSAPDTALDSAPDSAPDASLLRVKRVGDGDGADFGLQRMKRIDADLPPPPPPPRRGGRSRRSATYDPELLARRIVEYLRK